MELVEAGRLRPVVAAGAARLSVSSSLFSPPLLTDATTSSRWLCRSEPHIDTCIRALIIIKAIHHVPEMWITK